MMNCLVDGQQMNNTEERTENTWTAQFLVDQNITAGSKAFLGCPWELKACERDSGSLLLNSHVSDKSQGSCRKQELLTGIKLSIWINKCWSSHQTHSQRGQHTTYCRCFNAPFKQPFPLIIGAILSGESNAESSPLRCSCCPEWLQCQGRWAAYTARWGTCNI